MHSQTEISLVPMTTSRESDKETPKCIAQNYHAHDDNFSLAADELSQQHSEDQLERALLHDISSASKEAIIAKYLQLQEHHHRLRGHYRQLKLSTQRDTAAFSHYGHQKIPYSDPPIFQPMNPPMINELYIAPVLGAASDRNLLAETPPPPIIESSLEWHKHPSPRPIRENLICSTRPSSTSPISSGFSLKEYTKRINQLNLKIFSLEQDHEIERQIWREDNSRLREDNFMLRQSVVFFREKLSDMTQEKESFTMAAELDSENSFNQIKKNTNISSAFSARFLQRSNTDFRQRSVSTSFSDPACTAMHNFEQLKRSFTDSVKRTPPALPPSSSKTTMLARSVSLNVRPSEPFTKAIPKENDPIHNNKSLGEPSAAKEGPKYNWYSYSAKNKMERASEVQVQPWHSLVSSRPSQMELEEASRQLPEHSSLSRAPSRKFTRSLCAPLNLLSNP